jgi:anti-sigma factor RsiW
VKCAEAETFVHAYVDGELAGVDRDSYERHVLECEECFRASRLQARFKAAVRGHLPRPEVPARLRRRIENELEAAPPPPVRRWPWQLYPRLVPAMTAVVVLVGAGLASRGGRRSPLVAQAMRTYQAAMPMDVTDKDCRYIADWFRKHLDFAVKPPPLAQRGDCQGGRLVPVEDHMGAYFEVLTAEGQKLGVMVIDTDEAPLGGWGADHRVVNGRDVYTVTSRGASGMAFRDRDGLSYVVTSDLDPDRLANFLPASF